DERGCELYDDITRLEEYYPFRSERQILRNHAKDIVRVAEPDTLVELGSGTSEKTRFILDAMTMPATYVPFDVAESTLRDAGNALIEEYSGLDVHGIVGDFNNDLVHLPKEGKQLIALLGSTIGNFSPEARADLLATLRGGMTEGDTFLLGTDLQKDRHRLVAAYDDAQGVTAAFNLNVLARLNRELGANFDLDMFRHVALYNDDENWIEMRLVSLTAQKVRVDALDLEVAFTEGESIRTEISAKFTPDGVNRELVASGMRVLDQWTDDGGDFLLTLAGVTT
ncbi:MAG: L-histidine N(alpha)-methyltransferase, partial [Acidimicrobiales bacterium]|nr:L-histidine N(alpha)-methyltransferase [Acidimicrobiales bacterium]